jgi:hypothetical protein
MRKGLLKIIDQVLLMFNAHAQAHQVVRNTKRLSTFGWNTCVGHDGWVLDQTFNTAQTFSQRKHVNIFQEAAAFRQAPTDEDGDHATKGWLTRKLHLLFGNGVLRV